MRIQSLDQLESILKMPNDIIIDLNEKHVDYHIEVATNIQNCLSITLKNKFKLLLDGPDRSDIAQLEIPSCMLKDPLTKWVEIRISSMFPLVAISDESKVIDSSLEDIKCALEECGCIVVDQNIFILKDITSFQDVNKLDGDIIDNRWNLLFDYD